LNILVIVGHPDPHSFNHAIAMTVRETLKRNGHSVIFHDLYAEGFDPVLPKEEIPDDGLVPDDISRHCAELQSADGIVIVHPNWWGQPPALLKGWIDRVIRPGVAYRFIDGDSGEGVPIGLLRARVAIVFNTSNTPGEREQAVFGDPLESIWRHCIFSLCGVETFFRRTFNVIITSSPTQRRQWLSEVEKSIAGFFPQQEDGNSS
jgi:NAD(P)H dehydrogenase (quinone)